MAIIKCPECGNSVSDKSDKCVHCGFPIYMKVNMAFEKKKCSYCGCINEQYQNTCTNCGALFEDGPKFKEEPVIRNNINSLHEQPTTIINNYYSNTNAPQPQSVINIQLGKTKNKWLSFLLCLCLGYFGAHKFYEGKAVMGIIYMFTMGLFGIGWIVDCILLLCKPNPYYV